jgi:hypothetical protein
MAIPVMTINHADMSPESIASDITNGEHREGIATKEKMVRIIRRNLLDALILRK